MKDIQKILDDLDQTLAQISAPRQAHAQIQRIMDNAKAKHQPKKEQ